MDRFPPPARPRVPSHQHRDARDLRAAIVEALAATPVDEQTCAMVSGRTCAASARSAWRPAS